MCACMRACMSVCLLPRLLITSGVIWTPNKFCSFCMAAVVVIVGKHGLRIVVHCENQPYKTKVSLYKPLLSPLYS